jgi:sugar phosphate isomerase/epimerase
MAIAPEALVDRVQVNIPFSFLVDKYLPRFLEERLNPEIGLDAFSLQYYPKKVFQDTARAFKKARRRITLHAPFQDLLPGALDEWIRNASRQRLHQAFRWLPTFAPESIVCHTGYDAKLYQWDRQGWLHSSKATWKEFARLAADHGVMLMLENVYETEPELFLELLDLAGPFNLQICLDVGHLNAFGGGDFPRWLKALAPHIGQLHLHDNHGRGDEHLALGQGEIPIHSILHYLAEQGRQPIITLEPHQENSLAPSLEYLARIWPWD